MIVLDTHALIWWVSDGSRLSVRARRAIRSATRQGSIAASAISLFEITTLMRRGRLALAVPEDQWFADLRLLPELHFEPVSVEIARLAGSFDDAMPGDPADRIIAATAMGLVAPRFPPGGGPRPPPRLQAVW